MDYDTTHTIGNTDAGPGLPHKSGRIFGIDAIFRQFGLWVPVLLIIVIKSVIFFGIVITPGYDAVKIHTAVKETLPYIAYYTCFAAVFLCFAFLFKGKARNVYLLVIDTAVTFLLLCDLLYYRGFYTMPSVHMLSEAANLHNLSGTVISMFRPVDLLFFADLPLLAFTAFYRRNPLKAQRRSILSFLAVLLLSLSIVLYYPVKVWLLHIDDRLIYLYIMFDPNITSKDFSPIGYHLLDAYYAITEGEHHTPTGTEASSIRKWFGENAEALPANEYGGLFKGRNLILIQVESLEEFVIGRKVQGQEITPNLNRLLSHGFNFTNIYEQVNEGQSSDADFMANTSIYPVRQGSTFFRYPSNTYNSMPKLLSGMDYHTLAMHPDKGSYWNWMPALTSIGFQKCIDESFFKMDEAIGMGLSDGSYFRQALPELSSLKKPFYTFMVTLSSHAPFDLPRRFRALKLDKSLDKSILGGYFQSVNYVDRQIGAFIDGLDKSGLLKNTVVAVYGDHCGVHKFYQGDIDRMKVKEDWWIDNGRRIPFIIYGNGEGRHDIAISGGQVDIMPTLLGLMGADKAKYAKTAMGRDLLNTRKDFAVLQGGVYMGDPPVDGGQEKHDIDGLSIADLLIRSNWYK